MKILHIINAFYPPFLTGGAVTVAFNMCKFLAKKEHDVTVFTTNVRRPGSLFEPERKPRLLDGMQIFYFRNEAYNASTHLYLSTQLIQALRRTLSDYDVVHLHEYRAITSLATAYYAWKCRIPYVLQAHGQLPTWTAKSTAKSTFDFMLGHYLLGEATKVIATTKTEAEQYAAINVPNTKIEVIPNAIDMSEFASLPPKGNFRKKFSIDNHEKMVLYLGRIHQIKGLDVLLNAFASVGEKVTNLKLAVVGPDEGYLRELRALAKSLRIEDRVVISGPLYGREKLEAYVDADIYVLPSKYEIWGMTAVEAVACGTPVILTENCGVAEYLKDKVGLVVKSDRDDLCQALLKMLSDEALLNAFKLACGVIAQNFDVSEVIPKLERIYENMLLSAIKDFS